MRFLKVRTVAEMVGLSKSTLYARVRKGVFPKPIALSEHSVAFVEAEVLEWMKGKVAHRDLAKRDREFRAKQAVSCRNKGDQK